MPDLIDQFLSQQPAPSAPAATGAGEDLISQFMGAQTDVSQLPEFAEQGLKFSTDIPLMSKVEATAKSFTSDEPERLAAMLKDIPGLKVGRGKDNAPFVEVGGKKFQLNKPGLSVQDVANFLPAAAGQLLLSRFGKVIPLLKTGLVGGTAREALAGGIGAGGKEVGEQLLAGEEQGQRSALQAGAEGIFGLAGGLVGNLLGSGFANLFKRGAKFLVSGQLTRTAQEALKAIGVDPSSLDQKTLQAADTILRKQVGGRATPEEMAQAVAKADTAETGVETSLGQATGSGPRLRAEKRLAAGVRGDPAQEAMEQFEQKQKDQALQRVEDIAKGESPGVPRVNEAEAGASVRGALKETASDVEEAVNLQYKTANDYAEQSGLKASSDFSQVKDRFALRKLGIPTANEGTAPKTAALIDFVEEQFELANQRARDAAKAAGVKDPKQLAQIFGELSPTELEGIRKAIGQSARRVKDETDNAALIALRDKFDDFLEDSIGSQDPKVLDLYKTARDFAAEGKKALTPQGTRDPGGKLIQQTIQDTNVDQTVIDKIFGAGTKINPEGELVYNRLAKTLSGKPEALAAVRQAMVRRIALGTRDAQANPESLSPQKISTSIANALEGRGGQYISETLGSNTLRDLQVLQRQMARLAKSGGAGRAVVDEGTKRLIKRLGLFGTGLAGAGGGAFLSPELAAVGAVAGPTAALVGNKAIEKGAEALGRRAAEKAIKQAPILGPVRRLGAKGRAVGYPAGQVAQGLLPPLGSVAGAEQGESLFDVYGGYFKR